MNYVHKALYAFWSSFGIPAYLTGHVPDEAELPYITFEVVDGEPFSSNYLTAIVWVKQNGAGNEIRASYLDKFKNAIPWDGTQLYLPDGMLMLYRNGSNFLSYYDDPEDDTILGGRVSYQVNYYHM